MKEPNQNNKQLLEEINLLKAEIVALKASEEKHRTILDNSPNVFYSHTADHLLTYMSPRVEDILGYTQEEILVKWTELATDHPINKIGFEKTIKAIETGERQDSYELELIKKNGKKIWVEVWECPQVENGKTTAINGSLTEITERKRAGQIQKALFNISNAVITTSNLQELLGTIKNELGRIVDTSNFYIALLNTDEDTLSFPYFSDEKDEYQTFPADKTITKYVIETRKPLLADPTVIKELIDKEIIEDKGYSSEIWLGVPLKIGNEMKGAFAIQSYTDENAYNKEDLDMLEFISEQISIAITRKETEIELTTALEKAEESDRLKSAFLANMSHEIRTPMNGILGFTSLLQDPDLTKEEIQEYTGIIERSGDRMLRTINDLIDISRIEAGQMNTVISEVDINEQINDLYAFFLPEAEEKGIELRINQSLISTNAIIHTDYEKLYGILTNLVKNAIKFTREGVIEFGYEKKNNRLEFYVTDTGIGIPENRQKAIFDRFIQADMALANHYEGAGLGLAISIAYVKMLGGKMWLTSTIDSGSSFHFTIPYNIAVERNTK